MHPCIVIYCYHGYVAQILFHAFVVCYPVVHNLEGA